MSFRNLDGPKGGHASKQQPKQRRLEDTAFERSIKANIQEMQESVRRASEKLEHAQKSFLSKRMGESLDRFLEESHKLSQETEQLFRDWTIHMAGEPTERHRKKFSYDKLQKAFEEEVMHLKDVARQAFAAQQETLNSGGMKSAPGAKESVECYSMCEEQGTVCSEEVGLLDGSPDSRELSSVYADATMQNRIAQEREDGIRRIQTQVSEVNQIFKDLAAIVQEQGQQIESIESQAEASNVGTKQAVQELKKSVDRQRGTREKLCCLLALAVVVLCVVILPQTHMLEFRHAAAVSGPGSATSVAVTGLTGPRGTSPVAGVGTGTSEAPLSWGEPVIISKTGHSLT